MPSNDVPQPVEPLREPNPSGVTRREALRGALALSATSILSGCQLTDAHQFLTGSQSDLSQANPQSSPSGALQAVTLTVAAQSQGTIGPGFLGLSFEKALLVYTPYFLSTANTGLVKILQLLGPCSLRIGANSVDWNSWVPNGVSTPGQVTQSAVTALAGLIEATGWSCIYGVNLGGVGPYPFTGTTGHTTYTAPTTPSLAAAEVAFVSTTLGSALVGVEIGNEPEDYDATYFYGTYWDYPVYQSVWSGFRSAILARTPGIPIVGPASANGSMVFSTPFAQCVTGQEISIVTQHYYRASGAAPTSTHDLMLSSDTDLTTFLTKVYNAAQTVSVPLRVAECGCYYFGADATQNEAKLDSNGYCAALWVIDFLFQVAMTGAVGVNIHNGGNSGLANSPIYGSGSSVSQVRGEFYGMYLFAQAGQGTIGQTTFSGLNGLNVTAYAVATGSGGLNIVINNKDDGMNNLEVTVNLPRAVTSANLYQLTQYTAGSGNPGPDLEAATGITYQAGTIGTDGSFSPSAPFTLSLSANGTQLTCYVPWYSAVLIQTS